MKTITCSMYSIALAALIAGCGESKKSGTDQLLISSEAEAALTTTGDVRGKTVALVLKTLTNPFFKSMERGARKAEDELGIELIVRTGAKETSIEQQISIVRELIRAKVDAIVIAPAGSTELIPVLKDAAQAGIVIINIDNRLDPERARELGLDAVPFISVDNEQGAYLSAGALTARLTTPAQVAILEGIRTAQNAQDRKRGAMRAFAERNGITVVASETANWKIDEGYQVTARLFDRHPNIAAIFAANDMMALGAIRYLEENNKNHVLVAAYDNLAEARQAIRQGKMVATVDQQADAQGYKGVQFALRRLRGETVPVESLVDIKLITAETLDTTR